MKHGADWSKITLNCKYDTIYGYSVVRCTHMGFFDITYVCKGISHSYNYLGVCCSPTC